MDPDLKAQLENECEGIALSTLVDIILADRLTRSPALASDSDHLRNWAISATREPPAGIRREVAAFVQMTTRAKLLERIARAMAAAETLQSGGELARTTPGGNTSVIVDLAERRARKPAEDAPK